MSVTIQPELVRDCWDEAAALLKHHWEGTATYRRHEPFNPDKSRYIAYNDMGFLHLLTAREDGKLIGYFVVYVTESMHSQIKMATEDTFYIHPDHRYGRLALRFLKYIESYLAELGVKDILFSCEIENTTGIKRLLDYLGYQPVIVQYNKHLSPRADSAPSDQTEVAHVGESVLRA